jgi:5'-methylthioadenosine phosphorylase
MAIRNIGVIGGSGIYELDGLEGIEEIEIPTPFGPPSERFVTGRLGDARLAFLSRHGRGHRIPPHEVNYRANIWAMKKLGVEWLISLSAVGSMREEIRPGDMVIVDQFFDRTNGRLSSFFGDGIAAHVMFADPVSKQLAEILHRAATAVLKEETPAQVEGGAKVHFGGTYMVMNGPQFSTRAESRIYRQWGVDVIGMTNMPEAKLAREAEISYATVALATDYDCWHESEEDVSVEAILAILRKNTERARKVVTRAVGLIPAERQCPARHALDHAIMTDPTLIPVETRRKLEPILARFAARHGS